MRVLQVLNFNWVSWTCQTTLYLNESLILNSRGQEFLKISTPINAVHRYMYSNKDFYLYFTSKNLFIKVIKLHIYFALPSQVLERTTFWPLYFCISSPCLEIDGPLFSRSPTLAFQRFTARYLAPHNMTNSVCLFPCDLIF